MPDGTRRPGSADAGVSGVVEHFFRYESGRLVSILTGIFGINRLQMAEDVVQEAMARALKTWPYYGVPENPSSWILQTAKHLALDLIRREARFQRKLPEIITHLEQRLPDPNLERGPLLESEIQDDRLRLLFACCHPVLPGELQSALALKILCGFSPKEIARAFLISEVAVSKRLTRARHRLRMENVGFEIPAGPSLSPRLEGVLHTLYLLFNEGYKASTGERVVREELCEEAIRLAGLLVGHPVVGRPIVHALLALMLLNGARLAARTDPAGNILRLNEQDRSLWDLAMIQRGMEHLARSTVGNDLSEYHLQAGIAACHCLSPDDDSTDWPRILSLYDHLVEISDSPVIALNRTVAVSKVHGPDGGIEELEALLERSSLESYYLTHIVLGDFERQRQHPAAAAVHFQNAMNLTEVKSDQEFLMQRLKECETSNEDRNGRNEIKVMGGNGRHDQAGAENRS